jgi:hypothetical protein
MARGGDAHAHRRYAAINVLDESALLLQRRSNQLKSGLRAVKLFASCTPMPWISINALGSANACPERVVGKREVEIC